MEKSNIPEEVTITPIIKDIERLILRLFAFLKSMLFWLIKAISLLVRHFIQNVIILVLALLIGGLLGFYSDIYFPRGFTTTMVVEPTIAAKKQLYNDVSYINSLIKKEEVEILSDLLGITLEEAQTLSKIKVETFTSGVDRLRSIDELYKNIDSSVFRRIKLTASEEEDDIFAKKYEISLFGADPKVFSKLEPRFIQFLERVPELQSSRKNAIAILQEQKQFYQKQIKDLDLLKEINNKKMLKEAEKSLPAAGTAITLGDKQNQSLSDVLNVYKESDAFFKEMVIIESKLFMLQNCYKVHAHFSEYGKLTGYGRLKRTAIAGGIWLLIFLLITGAISTRRATKKRDA